VSGCASDDTIVRPPYDASSDGTTPPPADGSTNDSSPDGATDGGKDGATDGGTDAADSGTVVKSDAGPPVFTTFSQQINHLWCEKLASCCGATTFNLKLCEDTFNNLANIPGPALNRAVSPYLYDGGNDHITFHQDAAQQCFDAINNLHCSQSETAATFKSVHDQCLAATTGNLRLGDTGCRGSPECASPNHCDKADAAATGTCARPRDLDAGCDLGELDDAQIERTGGQFYEPQAQCGYLITGNPLYCANPDTYVGWVDGGRQNCATPSPSGAKCFANIECQSNICTISATGQGTCQDQDVIDSTTTCNAYRKPDGG